jgi:hypothetical protein
MHRKPNPGGSFLKLALYIADDRGALSRLLVRDVMTVCVEHIWPMLQRADGDLSDAVGAFCRIVASFILNHHKAHAEKVPGLLQVWVSVSAGQVVPIPSGRGFERKCHVFRDSLRQPA